MTLSALLCACSILPGQSRIEGLPALEGASLNQQEILMKNSGISAASKDSRRNITVFSGDDVVPQFVEGSGWSTALTFVNLDSNTIKFSVYFIADNGTDLAVPVNGIGPNVRALDITLPPFQTITAETPGTSTSLRQGWAYMDREVGDVIGGFAVFRQRGTSGKPDMEAVVPIVSQFDSRCVLLYDNVNNFATSFAIANPRTSAVTVTAKVRDENGNILSTLTRRFQPLEHLATTVSDYVPLTRGRRGSIEFITDNEFGVGVLGLRFNPSGAFTSFHALSNFDWRR